MRSNYNLEGLSPRGVASKLGMTRMPVEWMQSGSWRLPSGKALAEFALQAGFLAPLLFRAERFGGNLAKSSHTGAGKAARMRPAGKHLGEGSGR